jgi:hypothetical protein
MTQTLLKKPLTDDELKELAKAMNTKYKSVLDGRLFSLEAEHKDDGVYVTVLLKNKDSSFYYPVEARVKYKHEELGVSEAALFLIDYIDTYFEEFLVSQEIYLPIDWADYEYEAVDFQIKGQILNKKLDQLADELLGTSQL